MQNRTSGFLLLFSALVVLVVVPLVCIADGANGVGGHEPAPFDSPWMARLVSTYSDTLPADSGAAGLWEMLQKLHTRASLLMVTAHPDDEDGGMLTYESRGQGVRATLLTLNRGESGANVMSPDLFDALGLVRTEELLAAGRYYGVDQYWTRVVNDGFSKSKEESLSHWSHERVLADAVRVVRMTRPLVITSVFIGGPSDGHGNHQVAGQMAQEVFRYAGDPNKFPEQIHEGLRPWTPLKVYARVPMARVTEKGVYDYATHHWAPARAYDYVHDQWLSWPLSADVKIPIGKQDAMLGMSYLQLSREGLGHQKSQNGGPSVPPSGELFSPYHRFGSNVATHDPDGSFFDGIDTTLPGIASLAKSDDDSFLRRGLAEINADVENALRAFDAKQPEKTSPFLAEGLKRTVALLDEVEKSALSATDKYAVSFELRIKQVQFERALARSFQISVLPTVAAAPGESGMFAAFRGVPETFQVAIPGQKFSVNVHLNNPASTAVELEAVALVARPGEHWQISPMDAGPTSLGQNRAVDRRLDVVVPDDASFTRPYFMRDSVEKPYYEILDKRYLNKPLAPYPLIAWVTLRYQGATFHIGRVVQSATRITGMGTVLQPLVTGPAISVSVTPSRGILPLTSTSFPLTAKIHSNVKGPAAGTVQLELPKGWTSVPDVAKFSTERDGEDQFVSFNVKPSAVEATEYTVAVVARYDGRAYREGYQTVGYRGLRPYNLYRPSNYHLAGVDVKVAPGLHIGYVMGSGDEVPRALENLGIHVAFLTDPDLASGDLSKFDMLLLGTRTYAVRQSLRANNSRLLDYVKNGGVVMVQYNTPEFDNNYGPYPYTMTRDPEEVTDEASKVDILDPQNPVFQWPNRISEADFSGWVAERGSKFMNKWDSRYEPLLETHDPGQDPQKGGLLYAKYGKGIYIYNAYAFYRQLPEGVPGAYRIFANLVSLAKNPLLVARKGSSNSTPGK